MVKFLLSIKEIDANPEDLYGYTPLFHAIQANQYQTVVEFSQSDKVNFLHCSI